MYFYLKWRKRESKRIKILHRPQTLNNKKHRKDNIEKDRKKGYAMSRLLRRVLKRKHDIQLSRLL